MSKKVKIRGGKEIAKEINDMDKKPNFMVSHPIKRQIKLNQFLFENCYLNIW